MRIPRVVLIIAVACVAGCASRSPRLVWLGWGDAKVMSVESAVTGLPQVSPGVRAGPWGSAEDASFQLIEAETAERPHVHDHHDLTVVMLRGSGVLVVEEREYAMQVGDVVHVRRRLIHHFHPSGTVTGLVIYTPRLDGRDYREP